MYKISITWNHFAGKFILIWTGGGHNWASFVGRVQKNYLLMSKTHSLRIVKQYFFLIWFFYCFRLQMALFGLGWMVQKKSQFFRKTKLRASAPKFLSFWLFCRPGQSRNPLNTFQNWSKKPYWPKTDFHSVKPTRFKTPNNVRGEFTRFKCAVRLRLWRGVKFARKLQSLIYLS